MTIETLRLIFIVFLMAEFVLAIFYLRRCDLKLCAYTLWGLFALLVPMVGPFLVILSRPGNCAYKGRQVSRRGRNRRR